MRNFIKKLISFDTKLFSSKINQEKIANQNKKMTKNRRKNSSKKAIRYLK